MRVGKWTRRKQTEMSEEHFSYYSLQLYTKFVGAEIVQKWKEFKQQKATYVVKIETVRRDKKDSNKSVSQYPQASYQVWAIRLWSGRVGEFSQKDKNLSELEYSTP